MEFYKSNYSDDNRHKIIDAINQKPEDNDPMLEMIAECARTVCDAPIALITLVHRQRQLHAGRSGLNTPSLEIEHSFCRHNISDRNILEVNDASIDKRFLNNPLVVGDLGVRFYVGIPLEVSGTVVGRLCVLDRVARILGHKQRQGLIQLSNIASLHLQTAYKNRSQIKRGYEQRKRAGKFGIQAKRQVKNPEWTRRAITNAAALEFSLLSTVRNEMSEAVTRVSSAIHSIQAQASINEFKQVAALACESFSLAANLGLQIIAKSKKEQLLLAKQPVTLELPLLLSRIQQRLQLDFAEHSGRLVVMLDDNLPRWILVEVEALQYLIESLAAEIAADSLLQRRPGKSLLIIDLSSAAELRIQLVSDKDPHANFEFSADSSPVICDQLIASVRRAAYSFDAARRIARIWGWGFAAHDSRTRGSIVTVLIPIKIVSRS